MGAIAGSTIFLGLPIGRLRNPLPRLKAALNGVAIGVLVFLVWDILTHAWEPVDAALAGADWSTAARDGAVLAVGLVVGMAGLVYFDKAMGVTTCAGAGRGRETGRRRTERRGRSRRGGDRPRRRRALEDVLRGRPGADDRDRDRPAQLRRGAGHRQLGRQR